MKTSAIFSLIALTLTINLNASNPSQEFIASLENTYEENIEVADWMLDINGFAADADMIEIEEWMTDFDQTLGSFIPIENWMLDETLFTDNEELVNLEEWMFNESLFTDYEENLAIKEWMFNVQAFTGDTNNGNETIKIEDWMINFDTFYASF
ncbi:hypothetical protein [Marinilabilia salmonicolor]|uniref:hypothetical protein n=1 Tax=Marinilabilia salmonicolor TaxID=989 RepID=UPI00029A0255|nr:hypothetical protein [Marinilabilia salmonicolor]